ncbi:MAG TPA: hypothetical protein VM513_15990 [Kofleriaceae bacterium]|nr:hypothetical protein [Kofleriaceae bacterium]
MRHAPHCSASLHNFAVTLCATLLIAGAGCKTDKKASTAQTGSGATAGPAASSGSATAGSGSAGSGAASTKPAAITLPKGDGTPAKQTTKPLTPPEFDKLAELEYPGFEKVLLNKGNGVDVRHITPRPRLATTVTITPCFDCVPMELEKWKAKEASLKALLAEELRNLPDTIWEMGKTEVAGTPAIFTYQFGKTDGKDDNGNPVGAFSNAYAIYYNDGKNQIRVVAEYKDDPATREQMLEIAPKEDLERLAKAFLDAYTHAW